MERTKKLLKIFAVSDIHGCADALKTALDEHGFDSNNKDHLLVVLGDLFDRGIQNREVLAYLSEIKNKIIIRGNHEDLLMESLTSGVVGDLQFVNDTTVTLCEFFPYYHGESHLDIFESRQRRTAEMLISKINSMYDYFETENYIFVHGWLTENCHESDYHYATLREWHAARWTRWHRRYPSFPIPDGKTIVVGHTPAYYGSMFDKSRRDYDCSTFYGDHLIAIDGKCTSTGRLNVLVIEDCVEDAICYDIEVSTDQLRELASEKSRAIVLPFFDIATELKLGDKVRLFNTGTDNSLNFVINSLHLYPDFYELKDDFGTDELGSVVTDSETLDARLATYSPDYECLPILAIALS